METVLESKSAHTFLGHFGDLQRRDSKRGMGPCRDQFQVLRSFVVRTLGSGQYHVLLVIPEWNSAECG